MQIAQKTRLIDRHQRPEAHRNGGELPEVRHQPRMGIGREPLAPDLLAKVEKLFFGQPPLEESARIDPRRAMTLEIDQIAAVLLIGGMPEMHEAGIVEGGRRLETCDMTAKLGRFLIGFDDDRGGVPAHGAADRALNFAVARMRRLGPRAESC